MTPTLRDYQNDLVMRVDTAYEFMFNAPIVVLPTGGGKTVTFTKIAFDEAARGHVVWVVAHRQELISQASSTLTRFGLKHGIIKAGYPKEPHIPVQVASIQTLVRRLGQYPEPDLIILDECHHAVSATSRKVFAHHPKARLLGVTATPCRMNGAGLGSIFDVMLQGPSNVWLTEQGYLSPAKYFAPPTKANLSGVRTAMGDYVVSELEPVMDKPAITGDAVDHYKRICDGVPMLVFCVSVAHAHHVAAQYTEAGYRAAAVDGKLSDEDRKDRIEGLGTGKYQVITSCDLIGEGLDVPIVGAVQLLRPTQSPALHLQQIGRGLRPAEGKEFTVVLDHVGNVMKHGFASTDFKWSLEGMQKKKSEGALLKIRTCESCYSVHRTAATCPYCGYEYPVKTKMKSVTRVVDGKLVEIEQSDEQRREELKNARTIPELMKLAKERGYKRPYFWARKVYSGRSYAGNMPSL